MARGIGHLGFGIIVSRLNTFFGSETPSPRLGNTFPLLSFFVYIFFFKIHLTLLLQARPDDLMETVFVKDSWFDDFFQTVFCVSTNSPK